MRIEKGFTMIEVLIALLVLSIGVLGVVRATTVSITESAITREMATANTLVTAIIERMRMNVGGALAGHYVVSLPDGVLHNNCATSGCTNQERAETDIYNWQRDVKQKLPSGSGVITGNNPFTVTVSWQHAGQPINTVSLIVRLE